MSGKRVNQDLRTLSQVSSACVYLVYSASEVHDRCAYVGGTLR